MKEQTVEKLGEGVLMMVENLEMTIEVIRADGGGV